MIFTFLGTAAGKPLKHRNVSGLALEVENYGGWYLFDCGEATQHQLLHTPLSLYRLRHIFITHLHGDHIFGLFGLITSRALDGCTQPLCIFGPKGLEEIVASVVDTSVEHLGYVLTFKEIYGGFREDFAPFSLTALPLIHSTQSYAFLIEEKPKITIDAKRLSQEGLPPSAAYGALKRKEIVTYNGKTFHPEDYLIETPGQRIIIAGDNAEPEILCHYLDDLDLLIHEATYDQKSFNKLPQKYLHTTALQLARTAQRHNIKNLIATHISSRYSEDATPLLEELRSNYEGTFYVAKDFDRFLLRDHTIKPL